MDIKKSEFTISSATVSQCPKDTKPEFAFIGRSNVGKSSLINMLCQHKGLAKTSATPGKTLLINHFIINNEWYLVDLPGYGFAKHKGYGVEAHIAAIKKLGVCPEHRKTFEPIATMLGISKKKKVPDFELKAE